eukprot:2426805-Amphidinium_carterae.1
MKSDPQLHTVDHNFGWNATSVMCGKGADLHTVSFPHTQIVTSQSKVRHMAPSAPALMLTSMLLTLLQ